MATKTWSELRRKSFSPEHIKKKDKKIAEDILEMDLRDLREHAGLTQAQVAKAAEMTQSELSRAEHRDDWKLSTLLRIVHAMGGELEVVANVNGERVVLRRA